MMENGRLPAVAAGPHVPDKMIGENACFGALTVRIISTTSIAIEGP